jgi:signal transduction histidine kinase/ActR/RegA family two-component response regulator
MDTHNTPAKRFAAQRLVPAILIVGIATGAITLAAFAWAIQRTNEMRAETDGMAVVLHDIIDRTSRWDDNAHSEILQLLEKNAATSKLSDWLADRHDIVNQVGRILNQQITSAQLDTLLGSMDEIMYCRQACAEWRARQIAAGAALERTTETAQKALTQLRGTLDRMTGKQRLGRVVLLAKLRSAQGTAAAEKVQELLNLEQKGGALPVGQMDLADLALLVEQLLRQRDPDRLADLRDNQFRNVLARLQRETPLISLAAADVSNSFSTELEDVQNSIFGSGSRIDDDHQTIVPGIGGLYQSCEQSIKLDKERRKLLDRAAESLSAARVEQDRFNSVTRDAMQSLSETANQNCRGALRWAALVTLCCLGTFGFLATKISKALKRQVDEINAANVVVRKHAAELAVAKDQAEAFSRCKTEFLANMSHEIRTPMTAILGYADVLLEEGDLSQAPDSRIDAICTIKRNGDHLLRIINDILDLSKIEAGKMTVESLFCSPVQLLADVESLMRVRADSKGLDFRVECPGELPETIRSDPTRLRQILVNLVGNAVKFTDRDSVRVIARLVRGERSLLEFDVIDSGVGLTREQTERLFKAFSQADASTTRSFGGTGLGLVISKRLAEMLGGDITIVETQPGVGTTFRLTLSLGSLTNVKMVSVEGGMSKLIRQKAPPSPDSSSGQLTGCRILLAEDGLDNQRLIAFVVQKSGAQVVTVENGQMAVDQALAAEEQGNPFQVILMDMQMPVMDGYQAVALLRAKRYCRPIIALTAHAMTGDREKCIAMGCDDYATKPIDRSKLIETIAAWARKSQPTIAEPAAEAY